MPEAVDSRGETVGEPSGLRISPQPIAMFATATLVGTEEHMPAYNSIDSSSVADFYPRTIEAGISPS
jgi:hypothetical protein